MSPNGPGTRRADAAGHGIAAQARRLRKALLYSMAGLRDAWREPAGRLEIAVLIVALPVSCWLPVSTVEKLLLSGSVVAIFVVELLNTAIEAAVDRIGAERHELARAAKDLGSAAVLVTAVMAAVVWATIALPLLWRS